MGNLQNLLFFYSFVSFARCWLKGGYMMHFEIAPAAELVINKLESAGCKAYIAGGTVRELLMDEFPVSYIIVTDASREKIKQIRFYNQCNSL